MTGDARVNADAPIICATAEILANIALRDGRDADVDQVVMDEFHFYAEPDRGWAWQVPLIELPDVQFILMSATLGDVSRFTDDLTRRTGRDDRRGRERRAARTPAFFVCSDAAARDAGGSPPDPPGAGLCRALHPGRGAGARAGADERERVQQGREGRDRRGDRQLPVHRRVRQGALAAGPARHRRAPRGHAAEVPPAGGDACAGRTSQGHLRDGHARRRHQRADPDRAVHRAVEVRRRADAAAAGPRVPPDRRSRGSRRIRHRRPGRGPGSRTRRRQRARAAQGR